MAPSVFKSVSVSPAIALDDTACDEFEVTVYSDGTSEIRITVDGKSVTISGEDFKFLSGIISRTYNM